VVDVPEVTEPDNIPAVTEPDNIPAAPDTAKADTPPASNPDDPYAGLIVEWNRNKQQPDAWIDLDLLTKYVKEGCAWYGEQSEYYVPWGGVEITGVELPADQAHVKNPNLVIATQNFAMPTYEKSGRVVEFNVWVSFTYNNRNGEERKFGATVYYSLDLERVISWEEYATDTKI
jgi:hypothetical protein